MYSRALTFERFVQVVREVPVVREVLTHSPLSTLPTPSLAFQTLDLSFLGTMYKAQHMGFVYVLFGFLHVHSIYLILYKAEHLGFICAHALSRNFFTHGRDRREEHGIEKIDLQRACCYGMKEAAHSGREKFTYGGIVFIYDPSPHLRIYSTPLLCSLSILSLACRNTLSNKIYTFVHSPSAMLSFDVLSLA
jgi:hypothetical protein